MTETLVIDDRVIRLRLATSIEKSLEPAPQSVPVQNLEMICAAGQDILRSKYAGVAIFEDRRTLRHFLTRGMSDEAQARLGASWTAGILLGQLPADRRVRRLRNLYGRTLTPILSADHPPIHCLLAVPIVSAARTYGWLYFADKEGADAFTQDDETIAVAFASQMALAYESAQFFEGIQRNATHLQEETRERRRECPVLPYRRSA